MSKITRKTRKPCPSCDGKGKSYGSRYCGTCKGRNWITEKETIKVEGVDEETLARVLNDD